MKKRLKKNKILQYILIVILVITLILLGTKLYFKANKFQGEIDRIQIILEDKNKDGKRQSKIIENKEEINTFLEVLNNAEISEKNKEEKIDNFAQSSYYFFDGKELIKSIIFSDNTSQKIIYKNKIYNVIYKDKTLYDLYRVSKSPEKEISYKDVN